MDNWKLGRSFLEALRTPLGIMASQAGEQFHAIFGRDSLWSVILLLEAAQLRPEDQDYRDWVKEVSTSVFRGLATLQGKVENDYNEEQPGKIVHEYWEAPIPVRHIHTAWPLVDGRYYGTLDATFLYLISIHQYYQLFGDRALLDELWPSMWAALQWILQYGDADQDGLIEYKRHNHKGQGLGNHVWKDSGDSILLPEEEPLEHPLAWIEIQGYALAAYASMLALSQERGELTPEIQGQLTERRDAVHRGLQQFWLEEEECFAMALDKHKRVVKAVSSNMGHLLWSKAVDGEQASKIASRLTQPDLLTAWGLRCLSEQAYFYNPFAYHRGTIWPFDNAVIAIGLRSYGYDALANRIAEAVMSALSAFTLPVEVYSVVPARWVREPQIQQEWLLVDYLQSCSVQAWTAATMLYFTALSAREQ